MTPTFNATEQLLIDEAIRTGGEIVKPPWMQGHRLRAVSKEVERIRATMPTPEAPTSGLVGRYNAERRIKWRGDRFAVHEAGTDGLPICPQSGPEFADPKYADDLERLGYGPVNCGHCERTRST
jgi:hypothetical protein